MRLNGRRKRDARDILEVEAKSELHLTLPSISGGGCGEGSEGLGIEALRGYGCGTLKDQRGDALCGSAHEKSSLRNAGVRDVVCEIEHLAVPRR